MTMTLTAALGWLVLAFAIAVPAGLLIHRLEVHRRVIDLRQLPGVAEGVSGAVGFLGGAAAFLLGVLMLASLDHFNATKETVDAEALAYSAAFDSTAALDPADREKLQRDLVCLMRSVATNSWAAAKSEDLTGSDNTHAWRSRAFQDASVITPNTTVQENSLTTLQAELINSSRTGQQRLLAAGGDLPAVLWILVYVSIFVLTLMLAALLRPHPILAVTSLTAVLILSVAMLWTLTVFSKPFTQGDGAYIAPRSLHAVMLRLEGTYPGPAWRPCESLSDS